MCPMFVTECFHNKCLNCQPCVQFIFSPGSESDMMLSVMTFSCSIIFVLVGSLRILGIFYALHFRNSTSHFCNSSHWTHKSSSSKNISSSFPFRERSNSRDSFSFSSLWSSITILLQPGRVIVRISISRWKSSEISFFFQGRDIP